MPVFTMLIFRAWICVQPPAFLQEDVILKVTSTAICGSDLHLYLNFMPGMKAGDILGHEVCSFLQASPHSITYHIKPVKFAR